MSDNEQEQREDAGIIRRAAKWLESLARGKARRVPVFASGTDVSSEELLRRAAQCYAVANWADDACRAYERLGDDGRAAMFHEQQHRFREAALGYARAGDWSGAARCYQQCEMPDEAAECLLKAGRAMEAAWVWAHGAGRFRQALSAVRDLAPRSVSEQAELDVVLARCEAGTDNMPRAAIRLREAIGKIGSLPPDAFRNRLVNRAIETAEALGRPDLIPAIYANELASGVPNAREQWEQWAGRVLGDASGIPGGEEAV